MGYRYAEAQVVRGPEAFDFKTEDVRKFLQKQLDLTVNLLRKSDPNYKDIKDMPIYVSGARCSEFYCPFFVLLPKTAVYVESVAVDPNIPSIFREGRDDEEELKLIPTIEKFLRLYAFTKSDVKALKSRKYQDALKLNPNAINKLIEYIKPRYRTAKGGDNSEIKMVMVAIDPVKVFHDMVRLEKDDDNKPFKVKVEIKQRVKSGDYRFRVQKNYGGDNNKSHIKEFYNDLDSILYQHGGVHKK